MSSSVLTNYKDCTPTKVKNLFSSKRVLGASYTVDISPYQDVKIAPQVKLEDGGSILTFHTTFVNVREISFYNLIEVSKDPKYDMFGALTPLLSDGGDEANSVAIEVRFHTKKLKASYKNFKMNGRDFTAIHITESLGDSEDESHSLDLLFGDKEKLSLLHAIGLREKLSRQVVFNLFDLMDTPMGGTLVNDKVEGIIYAQDNGSGAIVSLYPLHSNISFTYNRDKLLVISTDTGALTLGEGDLSNLLYGKITPVLENEVTRYMIDIYFKDKSKLVIMLF